VLDDVILTGTVPDPTLEDPPPNPPPIQKG